VRLRVGVKIGMMRPRAGVRLRASVRLRAGVRLRFWGFRAGGWRAAESRGFRAGSSSLPLLLPPYAVPSREPV